MNIAIIEKHMTLYNNMCASIVKCHSIDECKNIADQSVAFAVYYKQISDDKTVQLFNEVKLRAWRQIAMLCKSVDTSQCKTKSEKIQILRTTFNQTVVSNLTRQQMYELLSIIELSDKDFEYALSNRRTGTVGELLRNTPEFQERKRKQQSLITDPEVLKSIERDKVREKIIEELLDSNDIAMAEVGITLDRKDRLRMKQVVFLIKEEVHSVMRQAAFDQKVTMQEVLRRGLKMWLIAHGYEYPE